MNATQILQKSLDAYQKHTNARIDALASNNTKGDNMNTNNQIEHKAINAIRAQEFHNVAEVKGHNPMTAEIANYLRTGNRAAIESKSLDFNPVAGGIRIPVESIVSGMCQVFPLMHKANVIETTSKNVVINADESELGACAKWKNDADCEEDTTNLRLRTMDVPLHMCYAVCDITRSMLEDLSDVRLVEWVNDRIVADMSSLVNAAMLTGDAHNTPSGIFKSVDKMQTVALQPDNLLAGLLKMLGSLESKYQADACWFMSQEAFTALLGMDNNQDIFLKHLTPDNGEGGSIYKLFGKPVCVVQEMPDETTIVLGNMKAGYTVLYNPDVRLLHKIEDAYVEKVRLAYRMRIGGAVTNSKAFVIGKLPQAAGNATGASAAGK